MEHQEHILQKLLLMQVGAKYVSPLTLKGVYIMSVSASVHALALLMMMLEVIFDRRISADGSET